jgi:hypothetical protein
VTPFLLFAGVFAGVLWAGTRSLKHGLAAVIVVGYAYGIVRANVVHTLTHLLFDGAVVALYLSQFFSRVSPESRRKEQDLRVWLILLIGWPTLLFALFPGDAPLVELVGWRANVFLLPLLLLGARLDREDVYDVARLLAVLNIGAALLGAAEFTLGVGRFFPENELTEIIFRSRDIVGRTAFRIPSSFANGHAYAGTMVVTLPLLIGGWVQNRDRRWHLIFGVAIVASLLGVFMAAARVHTVVAGLIILVATFAGGMGLTQRFRWAIALATVVWVVGGDVRLQRFTTLTDTDMVAERVAGSFNESFIDVVSEYPLGNGLASGGTSIPYFLRDERSRKSNPVLENEYARIVLELGWPGLLLWLGFIAWILSRRSRRVAPEWMLARRLVWVVCAALFASGLIGVGMFTAVPQTMLMLLVAGWYAARPEPLPFVLPVPEPPRRRVRAGRGLTA